MEPQTVNLTERQQGGRDPEELIAAAARLSKAPATTSPDGRTALRVPRRRGDAGYDPTPDLELLELDYDAMVCQGRSGGAWVELWVGPFTVTW